MRKEHCDLSDLLLNPASTASQCTKPLSDDDWTGEANAHRIPNHCQTLMSVMGLGILNQPMKSSDPAC
jgi:hypothetical protein